MVGIRGQLAMVILHFAEDLQLVWIVEISQWFVFCHLLRITSKMYQMYIKCQIIQIQSDTH